MPLQKRIAGVGIAKQSAKGSAAGAATWNLGVRGGSVLNVDVQQENDAITFSSRVSAYDNRLSVTPGAALQTRLWAASGGLLLLGALGSDVVTGPVSSVYTHTITPAATLPYLTHFAQLDTEYHKVADCKVNMLEIAWTERAPVEVSYELMGITYTGYTGAYTITNDESGNPRFIPPGGTFQLDSNSNTPVTAKIIGGRITINNNLVPIPLSAATTPDDVFEAEASLEVELRLMPTDTTEWRKIVTGTNVATTPTGTEIYGSFSEKFVIDANNDLTLSGLRTAFLSDYPEADPAGGPAQLTVVGRIKKPAGAAH
jgi:hypothetical protein